MNMRSSVCLLFAVAASVLVVSCGRQKGEEAAAHPGTTLPPLPGIEVTGDRTERNVRHNLGPVVQYLQTVYEERRQRNPRLRGRIVVLLLVEGNGEVGLTRILESTIRDKDFEALVLQTMQFVEFTPWGSPDTETEITLPLEFGD